MQINFWKNVTFSESVTKVFLKTLWVAGGHFSHCLVPFSVSLEYFLHLNTLLDLWAAEKKEEPKRNYHRLRKAVCLPKDLVYTHQTVNLFLTSEKLSKCFLLFQRSVTHPEAGYLMHTALTVGEYILRRRFYFSTLAKGMNFVRKRKQLKCAYIDSL